MNKVSDILIQEERRCFDFFWNEVNDDKVSDGFGLIRDNNSADGKQMGSIASVGFGLSAIIVGIENGWITFSEGKKRVEGTLRTFRNHCEHYEGFFYHFLNMKTGKNFSNSSDGVSIIDTTLFLNGALICAEYFGGESEAVFEEIYTRINWGTYYNIDQNVFYMGYYPDKGGGFGKWDMYAEQMTQYILGVGSPSFPVPGKIYGGFERRIESYGNFRFYNCPGGSLFTHQYSHAWFDFRNVKDKDGIDWFKNSQLATLAQRQYAIDNPNGYKGYSSNSWGLTACQGPYGYRAYGAPPYCNKSEKHDDGTIAPSAALGSIVFEPERCIEVLKSFEKIPNLKQKYGYMDAYYLEGEIPWVSDRVIGIDKGITILMIENYRSELIWNLYMNNKYVNVGARKVGLEHLK